MIPQNGVFSFGVFVRLNYIFKLIIAGNCSSSSRLLLLIKQSTFVNISATSSYFGGSKRYLQSGQRRMITRAKLVEQLREYQIRSQHKCPALTIFSPKPQIASWADVTVAILCAILFSFLVISSYVTLYFRHFWLSFVIICLGILLPIRLRISRQALARKRERRMLLPLSM